MIAGLGVAAGVESDLGPLAAGYVLLLALVGPIVMHFDQRLLPLVDPLDRFLERVPLRWLTRRVRRVGATAGGERG